MEISKEFAEKQYQLHKQELNLWSKILKSFDDTSKKRLTKKEKEIIETNNLVALFHKRKKN